jgi:hypothetical protein
MHKAQIHDAELGEKDGRRAQTSSVEHKLLYEIHPRKTLTWYVHFSIHPKIKPIF